MSTPSPSYSTSLIHPYRGMVSVRVTVRVRQASGRDRLRVTEVDPVLNGDKRCRKLLSQGKDSDTEYETIEGLDGAKRLGLGFGL